MRGSARNSRSAGLQHCLRRVCIGVMSIWLLAGSAAAERLPVTSYTTTTGLPHDRIKRIFRDSRGFLWFGTAAGLSRFDGERFVTYTVAHGLSHASINDVIEARDGTYWIATNGGGVCRFRPGAAARTGYVADGSSDASRRLFTCVPVGDGLANRVNVLFEDRRSQIWVGTDSGLFRLDPADEASRFVRMVSRGRLGNVWALAEDRDGHIWVGHARGLARYRPDGFDWQYQLPGHEGPFQVWAVMFDRDGRLWLALDEKVLAIRPARITDTDPAPALFLSLARPQSRDAGGPLSLDPGDARAWTTRDGLVSRQPGIIRQTADGRILIGSGVWTHAGSGLNEFDGRTLRSFTIEHGLSEDPIISVAEDVNRNLWLGTYATGAMRVARAGVVAYGERDGLVPGQVFAIVPGGNRDLYTITAGLHIHRFDGARFTVVRPNVGAAEWPGWDHAPLVDRRGEWWIPTQQGLYRFGRVPRFEDLATARPIAVYGSRTGLPGDDVLAPFEDSRGDIWFGGPGRETVSRWESAAQRFRVYGPGDGLSGIGMPTAFREDRAGNIWIGSRDSAVARFRAGRFDVFRAADGVPLGQIAALHVDGKGRLWIGSRDAAVAYSTSPDGARTVARDAELARVDDPDAARPHIVQYPPEVLSGLGARCISDDGAGGLYIGGDRGVQRFEPETGRVRRLTRADGLPSDDVEVAFRDPDGVLWFGTWKGVARLRGGSEAAAAPPSVFIGDLRIRGVRYPLAELGETDVAGLELQPHQNQLDVEFFSVAFAAGQRPLYQYRLEGVDTDWGPVSDRQHVTFVSLAPGRYRFLVRSINADAVASSPAAISFTVLPPIWKRAWFIAAALAAAFLLVMIAHRARVARLLAVERIRTGIATDLHDDIGASLSQIAILSEVVRQQRPGDAAVADPLGRIAATSRELVDAMSDIVWAINAQRDSLRDLTQRMRGFASDVLSSRGITFTFQAPPHTLHLTLGGDIRRHVFLIFKEAINNLARHSDATQAAITLTLEGSLLSLEIIDNGRGFNPDAPVSGHGLASIRSRAKAIGATLALSSTPGHGMRLRLDAPVGRRAARLAGSR